MKKLFKFCLIATCAGLFTFLSCEKDEIINEDSTDLVIDLVDTDLDHAAEEEVFEMTNEIKNRELVTDKYIIGLVKELNLDTGVITTGDYILPDGSVESRIYIGEDIVTTVSILETMTQDNVDGKQYITNNLVNTDNNRVLTLTGWTGNGFALTNKARTALQRAVANYNNISGSSLRINLTFGTSNADMIVYDSSSFNNGSGGSAGFPSGGNPHRLIQIFGLEGFSLGVNEHVITHEIGHSIGFRHSDFFNRSLSCGTGGNEGDAGVGANYVNGTPSGFDPTSVMNACFSASVSGNFNGNDITAIRFMYGVASGPCDGVPQWQPGLNYPVGFRVVYLGNLFERTFSGWIFITSCS